jgi:hypothetical protein
MRLFRVVVPLLVSVVLPCVAQSPTPKQPAESAPAKTQSSPLLKLQNLTVIEKSSACYSIREYRFAVPKDSRVPKLKSYSTCVPAARFEARNVIAPSSGSGATGTMGSTAEEGR